MLSIPIISTMKRLPGALELQADTSNELEPTFSFVPASRPESKSGPDTVNNMTWQSASCQICAFGSRELGGGDGSWQHPGPVMSESLSRRISACLNLKQGYIRILPGVQTASSQLITK